MKLTESILKQLIEKVILEQSNKVRIIAGKRYWIPRVKEFLDKNPSVDEPMLKKLANEKVLPGYLGSYEKWEDLPYTDRVSEAINFTVKAPKMVKQGIPTKKRGGGLDESLLNEQDEVVYTKKEVELPGRTPAGRKRMGFQYTASFKGVKATGKAERSIIKARASAYRTLLIKMSGQKKNQASAMQVSKLAKATPSAMATSKTGGDSDMAMMARAKPAPMPQAPAAGSYIEKMPLAAAEPDEPKPAPMQTGNPDSMLAKPAAKEFDGKGMTTILKMLHPNDSRKAALTKLMQLPTKHPARVAFRKAYRKKDRS